MSVQVYPRPPSLNNKGFSVSQDAETKSHSRIQFLSLLSSVGAHLYSSPSGQTSIVRILNDEVATDDNEIQYLRLQLQTRTRGRPVNKHSTAGARSASQLCRIACFGRDDRYFKSARGTCDGVHGCPCGELTMSYGSSTS